MKTRIPAIAVTLALVLFGAAACGGDDDAAPSDAAPAPTGTEALEPEVTEPTVTETTVTEPDDDTGAAGRFDLDLIECEQFAMQTPIAPEAARRVVPDDVELFVRDGGMATMTHVSKTCSDIVVDGTSLGPGHFDTEWIRVEGPAELRDVPEHPDLDVLETDYFYPVSFVTDNEAYAAATQAFGIPMDLADSMEMDPIAAGEWTGRVVTGDTGYEWVVDNTNAVELGLYFVHILDRTDDDLQYHYEILCPAEVDWFGGEASLTRFGGSDLETALGADLPGRGGALRLTCDVTIDRTSG